MTALEWLSVAAGTALVLFGLREVFHTLLHPGGVGVLTPRVFRRLWRTSRPLGGRGRSLAGPLGVVVSAGCWTALLAVGFALVYLPFLPGQFTVAEGVTGRQAFPDALYLSVTVLSTLGFGDLVPEETPLRFAVVTEALVGFALLTASISWILSITPALLRRRAVGARLTALLVDGRLAIGGPPAAQAVVLHELAAELAAVRVDLFQSPSSYFFHAPEGDLSLAAELVRLHDALPADPPPELADPVRVLRHAVEGVAEALAAGPFGLAGETAHEVLEAYARDHRR